MVIPKPPDPERRDDSRAWAEQLTGLLQVALRETGRLGTAGDRQQEYIHGAEQGLADALEALSRYIAERRRML